MEQSVHLVTGIFLCVVSFCDKYKDNSCQYFSPTGSEKFLDLFAERWQVNLLMFDSILFIYVQCMFTYRTFLRIVGGIFFTLFSHVHSARVGGWVYGRKSKKVQGNRYLSK